MQETYYVYEKPEYNVLMNRMPIWFKEVQIIGDQNQGSIILHSQNDFDEYWGANAKMELDWVKMEREDFYHPREVQKSIDIYNSINFNITQKKNDLLNSHNITWWRGQRSKRVGLTIYEEKCIHAVFYCEFSGRVINLHCGIINEYFGGFEPYILDAFKSLMCH